MLAICGGPSIVPTHSAARVFPARNSRGICESICGQVEYAMLVSLPRVSAAGLFESGDVDPIERYVIPVSASNCGSSTDCLAGADRNRLGDAGNRVEACYEQP
jgi:hypothetical protein